MCEQLTDMRNIQTNESLKLVYYYSWECDLRDHAECSSTSNCPRNQSIPWFVGKAEAQSKFKNRQSMGANYNYLT